MSSAATHISRMYRNKCRQGSNGACRVSQSADDEFLEYNDSEVREMIRWSGPEAVRGRTARTNTIWAWGTSMRPTRSTYASPFECSVLSSSCSLSKNLFDLSAQLPNKRHRSMLSHVREVQFSNSVLAIPAPALIMSTTTISATVTAADTTTATTTVTTQVPLPQRSRRH